jgi:hypothetical protein
MSNETIDLTEAFGKTGASFTGLELKLPETLTLEDWAAVGRKLVRVDQVTKWWLGDWAAFGLRKYGQLKEFAEANGINYGGLRQMAWVSSSVELSRRRDNVDWSKHMEVAALKPRDQTKWLQKAATEEMPLAELRRQIRQSQATKNALESDGPTIKFISRACDDLIHWLTRQPADFWTTDRKAIWRKRLEPLVKFYERLA